MPMLFRGEEYNEESANKLNEALGWLDAFLDGRAFVAGDNLTIADISIVVTMTNLEVRTTILNVTYVIVQMSDAILWCNLEKWKRNKDTQK